MRLKTLFGICGIGLLGAVPIVAASCGSKPQQTEAQKMNLTSYVLDHMIARNADKFTKKEGEKWNNSSFPGKDYSYEWPLQASNIDFEYNTNFISSRNWVAI